MKRPHRLHKVLAITVGAALAATRRGPTCEFCGVQARPRARCGKARVAHNCPHGQPCARGDKLLGIHQNRPACPECAKARPR